MDAVDPHLRMNVQARDNNGDLVDQDRDVNALAARLGERVARRMAAKQVRESLEAEGLTQFPASEVAPQRVLDDGEGRLIVYPALTDRGDSVALVMATSAAEQRRLSRDGYTRMVLLCEHKTARLLQRTLKDARNLGLQYAPLGTFDTLADRCCGRRSGIASSTAQSCRARRGVRTASDAAPRPLESVFRSLMQHANAIIGAAV